MTGKERISNILARKSVDRIGVYEHFWSDTQKIYAEQGHLKPSENILDHFGLEIQEIWALNYTADLDFVPQVISETEDTVTKLDGNGAIFKTHKHHDTTPEHIDFTVKERDDWSKYREMLLDPTDRRINFDGYRFNKNEAKDAERFFCLGGLNVFEFMKNITGHENMLVGMALDPEWIIDMAEVFCDLTIELQKKLFDKEGKPDGLFYYEDLGFKERPFLSPAMYKELLMPIHKKMFDFAHSEGLPVIFHSCGFVEPLIPYFIEAGIDCLQVIEVKAGMDLLRIHKNFGDKISLMGGIDVRCLYTNDKTIIDAELESKIPFVKQGGGFVLHSDHSIPNTVNYDTLRYFIERGLELGKY